MKDLHVHKLNTDKTIFFALSYARTHCVALSQLILVQHSVELSYTVSNAPLSPPQGTEPSQSWTHFSRVQSTYHALVPTLPDGEKTIIIK